MSGNNQLTCGIGADTGPYLAVTEPLAMSGNVWYVNFATGINSATGGLERLAPLKTLEQAVTNAAVGDIIVLLETHQEVMLGTLILPLALTVIGEGKNAGLPMAKLSMSYPGTPGAMLALRGAGTRLLNILIGEPAQAAGNANISVEAENIRLEELHMSCGANNNSPGVTGTGVSKDGLSIDNCTFVSVATLVTDRPEPAVEFTSSPPNRLKMRGTTFDNGTVGFFDAATNKPHALVLTGAQLQVELEGISLLRGADIKLDAATTGYVNIAKCTGGGRVVW